MTARVPAPMPVAASYQPEHQLRALVLLVLDRTQTRQVDLAATLNFSPKHINAVLRGRHRLNIDLAGKMLRAMGYELLLSFRPIPEAPDVRG